MVALRRVDAMSRERALLRRLMEARRAFHNGPSTPEKFAEWDAALAAADALLAEPEGEALDPRTEYERFIVGWVAQHAPEVSERAGAAYREVASRPTPRSRAEAEAMLHAYDWASSEKQESIRAALLAALTGEVM